MKYLKADEIVDLELFIEEDKAESEDYKNNRDFEFYSQASEFNKQEDTRLLGFWIEKMRAVSGKMSVGKFTQMIYALFALLLIGVGGFLGYSLGLIASVYLSFEFALLIVCVFFIFSCLFLGITGKIANFAVALVVKLILGKRANLNLVEGKNKNYFAARGKFLSQFFGLSFVVLMFFSSYVQLEKTWGISQFDIAPDTSAKTIQRTMKVIAFPWSLTMGEGLLYPSLAEVEYAKENIYLYEAEQSVWHNFFLAGIFVYGVLPRLIVFFVCLFKGRNHFGKHKVLNDSDINIILNRMKLSSSNKTNWQSLKNDKDCKNLLLLRGDLVNYSEAIKQRASKLTKFEKFNLQKYEFLSDFFTEDFASMQAPYKNFTIAFLSDDYNDEVFENMQNLINVYPEKNLNVLLLGRYNASENSFEELVSVEKSWWERKLNAISTQNINIF